MRILIAEDDFTTRTMLLNMLKKEGYEVIVTINGAEAWQTLQQPDAPRLILLDWMMPKLGGLEVVHRIRTQPTEQPPYIIMLTIKDEKIDIITGLDAGANDYLTKPFDSGELRARVAVGSRMIELQDTLATRMAELQLAHDQIKTLRGIIPICASCKKIRDDQGYWNQVEVYIREHTEAEFTHGICPECIKKLYPDYSPSNTKS